MTCEGCSNNVKKALEGISGVNSAEVNHLSGIANVEHDNVSREILVSIVQSAGYTVDGKSSDFNWRDGSVWKKSAHNTKWCLIGCSIGDFGTIAAFQFVPYLIALEWEPMMIMALAMFNGIMTSIALETFILSAQMALKEAFRVAIGMCWGTLVAAEFLAGTTGIGFVENVAKKYFQYEVIWITIFVMGMLGLLFDVTLRKLIDKYIPWRGKG